MVERGEGLRGQVRGLLDRVEVMRGYDDGLDDMRWMEYIRYNEEIIYFGFLDLLRLFSGI